MKKVSLTLLICSLITIGFSQAPAKLENIKKLLDITGAGKMGTQLGVTMINNMKPLYKDVPDEFWDEFKKELTTTDWIDMFIPVYEKFYSDDDIKQLIQFYQSPIGKKVISNTPLIMQESMQIGQTWGQKLGEKLVERIKAKGYLSS